MDPIPFDKRSGKIWYNGKLVDWKEANLHILSHGLHYASCVFEGERVYNGKIFKLREHTNRLIHSAERMGMKIPYSADEIDNACKEIISVQNVKSGYVRPVVWRGSEMMAISSCVERKRNDGYICAKKSDSFGCSNMGMGLLF